jgi:asparagine synthase (glutamine-hydrolysing)
MLCEWINKCFPHRVIFSGEGSDELFCGYLYSHNAPSEDELYLDSIRLVNQLYKYDVLRAERCTSGNSLELREPFLDKELVELALQLSGNLKKPKEFEKDILRKAFEGYLPHDVLWRRKAAFSDAVSGSEKPWYKWIQESIENKEIYQFGGTKESDYYKTLFTQLYTSYKPLIPLWLPKWSNTGQEPSATVLNVYKKEEHSV